MSRVSTEKFLMALVKTMRRQQPTVFAFFLYACLFVFLFLAVWIPWHEGWSMQAGMHLLGADL